MSRLLTLVVLTLSTAASPAAADTQPGKLPEDCYGVYTWCSWSPRKTTSLTHPLVKGVSIVMRWGDIEPEEGKFKFDTLLGPKLIAAHKNGFYVHLMVWVVPGTPKWLYANGVPVVQTPPRRTPRRTTVKWSFPYYLDTGYKRFFFRMIDQFGRYVSKLPPDLRKRIIFVQSAEGSTGDGQPYKGKPTNPKYAISAKQWSDFRMETWGAYKKALARDPAGPLPILVNNDANRTAEHEWLVRNFDIIGCKQGMFSHGYHINDTQTRLAAWRPFASRARQAGKTVFTRGEQDQEWKVCGWSKRNPPQAFYWSALFGLHCGLDIWNIPSDALVGAKLKDAVEIFTKYAGKYDPATSPAAFCALRRGLDASDKTAFPETEFGKAHRRNTDRYLKIAAHFASRGARQGDPPKALGGGMMNRQRDNYNDVGWGILRGNYWRFLEQIDPDQTSVGYWHVGPKEHIFSRFARGFQHSTGKKAMRFRLDKQFFGGSKRRQSARLRVVYLDQGTGAWSLVYQTPTGPVAAMKVTCRNTGKWADKQITVTNAIFTGSLPGGADLTCQWLGGDDTIFHLIELTRPAR
ncbi:MAG: hypothetical protein H8E53_11280 [Planctomycetes bacterium]|nr:hypothetical protein [Planctomycetota bacterium]